MQPVKASRQAEVGAIVHDELDACSETRPKFASLVEHSPSVSRLVAILEQRNTCGSKFLRGRKHSGSVGETCNVENRIESPESQHEITGRDAASRVSTVTLLFSPRISR